MKILILSWYFPPVNTIGAVRVGKLARFLVERGHEIGVVAGSAWGHPETLPLEVPNERITYVRSRDVNALPNMLHHGLKRLLSRSAASAGKGAGITGEGGSSGPAQKSAASRIGDLYVELTNVPDDRIGWLPGAYREALRLCRTWQPDLIFASGPPFTALLLGRLLSARLRLPWIAELRDRWADDPYYVGATWRGRLDDWLERRVLATAKGLVTVTEPWAEFYRQKYEKPVATIYNGYDPADFDFPLSDHGVADRDHLVIGYAGRIYPGRRDPTPLFEALRTLGAEGQRCRVVFCGTDPAHVLPLATRAGVQHLVEVRPGVPYKDSLEFQRSCDVLLLMQWNDPREQGNCPGKLFEYVASLRPVLVHGLEDGVPAAIIRERSAGICSNDPGEIAAQLRLWLAQKREHGRVPRLPAAAREGLSRTIQFEQLERFLAEMMRPSESEDARPAQSFV